MTDQSKEPVQRRLRILTEIETIYALPHFTPEEQIAYFSLSPEESAVFEQLHS